MITLQNVNKTYKSKNKKKTLALDNVSLNLPNQGLVFILGKSGSGKTTLLNILGGLDSFDSGKMIVDGKNISQFKEKDFDDYRKSYVGFIFQDFNLLDEFNVKENIELALRLEGKENKEEDISSLLQEIDLADIETKFPSELSGGQKQRIAIARALIKNPKMILADEPCGSLDDETGENIIKIFKKQSENKLVVVVSHDRSMAQKYADQIIEIRDGKIIQERNNSQTSYEKPILLEKETSNRSKKSGLPLSYSVKMGLHYLSKRKIRLFFTVLFSFLSLSLFSISNTISNYSPSNSIYHSLISRKNRNFKINYESKEDENDYFLRQKIDDGKKRNFEEKYGLTTEGIYRFSSSFNSKLESYPVSLPQIDERPKFLHISQDRGEELGFSLLCGKLPQEDNEIALTDYHFFIFQKIGFKDFSNHSCPNIIPADALKDPSSLLGKTVYYLEKFFTISGFIDTNSVSNYQDYLAQFFSLNEEDAKNYIRENPLDYAFFQQEVSSNYPNCLYCFSNLESKVKNGYGSYALKNDLSPITKDEPKSLSYRFDRFAIDAYSNSEIEFLDGYQGITNSSQAILSSALKASILEVDDSKKLEDMDKQSVFFEFKLEDGQWAKKETMYQFAYPSDFLKQGRNSYILNFLLNHLPNNSDFEKYCLDFYHLGTIPTPLSAEMKAFAYFTFLTNYSNCKKNLSEEMDAFILKKMFKEGIQNPFGIETQDYLNRLFENYVFDKYREDEEYIVHCAYQNTKKYTVEVSLDLTVIGFFEDPLARNQCEIQVSQQVFDQVTDQEIFSYDGLLCNFDGKDAKMFRILKDGFNNNLNDRFTLENPISGRIKSFNQQLSFLAKSFTYIGWILGALSVLLFCYFVFGTILSSSKEIGILRSLGTKKSEIFRIVFTESFFVALVNFILAVVASIVSIHFLNQFGIEKVGLPIYAYFFGWGNGLFLFAFSLLTALLASSMPILFYTGKKPAVIMKRN